METLSITSLTNTTFFRDVCASWGVQAPGRRVADAERGAVSLLWLLLTPDGVTSLPCCSCDVEQIWIRRNYFHYHCHTTKRDSDDCDEICCTSNLWERTEESRATFPLQTSFSPCFSATDFFILPLFFLSLRQKTMHQKWKKNKNK